VHAGIEQGCSTSVPRGHSTGDEHSLSMIWTIEPAATPRAGVLITARLIRDGRPIGFTFDRTASINANPYAVFERTIADMTCNLFREAFSPPGLRSRIADSTERDALVQATRKSRTTRAAQARGTDLWRG
jgi:hypothetical protein